MKQILSIIALLALSSPAFAGPGHDHGEGAFAGGAGPATHFELTDRQMDNLGIASSPAEFLPMQHTVDMLAFTELLPERKAAISPRFGGKVVRLNVKVGEAVKKGQALAVLAPITVGSSNVTLKSPLDGFVLQLHTGIGAVVDAGDDIMEIGDPSQMLVRGVAYETPDIKRLQVGQRAEVHLDIDPDRHIDGKVQRINRVVDPESRTFSVYALVDTPKGDIQPGLQGTMEIFTGDDTPVLSIPKSAVLGELDAYFVYVINGHEVEKRDITMGAKSGHHVEVTSGLFPNDKVVTRGNYQLQYISVGGVQEHDHSEDHDEQEGHSHDDGHEHDDHEDDHSGHEH
jgi:multidrug efflux pump subunit AcrA (membrane-fusion protein)